MTTRQCLLLSVLGALFAVLGALSAYAAEGRKEKDLGTFGVWRAYAYEEGGQTVCYMVTTKTFPSADKKKDRNAYLMITHRPVEASVDVFSYGSGTQLDSRHGIGVRVGKGTFDLFSARDTAWARDSLTDHKLAAAVRTSSELRVSAIPAESKATSINDRFSLDGALPAYRAIGKACGLPDPEVKKKPLTKAKALAVSKAKKPAVQAKTSAKKTEAAKKAPAKTTRGTKAGPKQPLKKDKTN